MYLIVGIKKENYGFQNFHTSNNHLNTGFCQKYQLECIYTACSNTVVSFVKCSEKLKTLIYSNLKIQNLPILSACL